MSRWDPEYHYAIERRPAIIYGLAELDFSCELCKAKFKSCSRNALYCPDCREVKRKEWSIANNVKRNAKRSAARAAARLARQ